MPRHSWYLMIINNHFPKIRDSKWNIHSFYSLHFHAKYAIVNISSSIFLNSLEKTNYHNTHRALLTDSAMSANFQPCREALIPTSHLVKEMRGLKSKKKFPKKCNHSHCFIFYLEGDGPSCNQKWYKEPDLRKYRSLLRLGKYHNKAVTSPFTWPITGK